MFPPFKKIGHKIIQENEEENIGNFKKKKEEELSFVEKCGDQPQQVDINGNCQEPDGHQDVGGQVKTDAVKVEVAPGVDEHDCKQDNTDQPENKVLEKEMQPAFAKKLF